MGANINSKRVYDNAAKSDGHRVLVDRMWPRGVRKEEARIDAWLKDVAPPKELIGWYHEDKDNRYQEFAKEYRKHLRTQKETVDELLKRRGTVTLVTSVRDVEHSHIPVLRKFLLSRKK